MPEAKSYIKQIILIILLLETLFVALSLADKNDFKLSAGEYNFELKYYSLNELLDFRVTKQNTAADSLINTYLDDTNPDIKMLARRRHLSMGEPHKKNINLINPQLTNGTYALDNFFAALMSRNTDSCPVRIAHYGDSQLEGDRVTNVLRRKFQQKFGGNGPGFIPFRDIAEPASYIRTSAGSWCRFTVFDNRFYSDYYGIAGMVFKFNNCSYKIKNKASNDSLNAGNDTTSKWARLSAESSGIGIQLMSSLRCSRLSVMYGRSSQACAVSISDKNHDIVFYDTLQATESFKLHTFDLPVIPNPVRLNFTASESPDFYGLIMDDKNGVQVDNYAIRGHGGGGLMSINQNFLASQIQILNTKLIIFQYGANVVPYVRDSIGFKQLEEIYFKLFTKFRNAAPGSSIIVIGAGDMARKTGEGYASYPQIGSIVEAQRKAALKAGCAFWDLYATMGGQGSILTWSSKKLASPDGHFSGKGQELTANELFKAIISEYNSYLTRNSKSLISNSGFKK